MLTVNYCFLPSLCDVLARFSCHPKTRTYHRRVFATMGSDAEKARAAFETWWKDAHQHVLPLWKCSFADVEYICGQVRTAHGNTYRLCVYAGPICRNPDSCDWIILKVFDSNDAVKLYYHEMNTLEKLDELNKTLPFYPELINIKSSIYTVPCIAMYDAGTIARDVLCPTQPALMQEYVCRLHFELPCVSCSGDIGCRLWRL